MIYLRKIINSSIPIQKHIYTNCYFNRKKFSDLFASLFRPLPILEKSIMKNKEAVGMRYVAATFSFQQLLGDFKEGADFFCIGTGGASRID